MASSFQNDPAHSFWHSDIGKSVAKAIKDGGGSGWLPGSKVPSKDVFQTILNVYSVEKKYAITYVDDTTPPMLVDDKVCIDMHLIRDDLPECPEFFIKINDGEPIYVQTTQTEPDSGYKFSTWASKDGSIAMHTEYDTDVDIKNLVFTSGVSAWDDVYIYDTSFLVSISPNCPMYITQFDITDADNNICEIQLSDRDKLFFISLIIQLAFDTETAALSSVTILKDGIGIVIYPGSREYYDEIREGFANEWFDGNYDIFSFAVDDEDPVFDAFLTRLGCKLPNKYNTLVELLWEKYDNGWDGRCCIAI